MTASESTCLSAGMKLGAKVAVVCGGRPSGTDGRARDVEALGCHAQSFLRPTAKWAGFPRPLITAAIASI